MVVFSTVESEGAYLAWLSAHPDGVVANTTRPTPNGNYFVLHRTSCWHICGDPTGDGKWTGRDYQKLCSEALEELEHWAAALGGKPTSECTCWTRGATGT